MTFLIPTREQARAGLRAMKTVLTASHPLDEARCELLAAAQQHLLRTDYDLDALAPITPAELAADIDDPALRAQLVSSMATLALWSERLDPRELEAIEGFAAALSVHPHALDQARRLNEERLFTLRFDVARRGLGGAALRQLYDEQGVAGVAKNLASLAGIWENTALAARYRALEGYADGTLGKELFRFYQANGFPFPGEKRGAPESLLPHDLTHVLAGYGTDPHGEALTIALQAGYRREDPFSVIIFLLLQAQHGLRMTPFAEEARGFLSRPGFADELVRSFSRGTRMTLDLTSGWDFWAVMDQPVAALRARYGIAPWGGG